MSTSSLSREDSWTMISGKRTKKSKVNRNRGPPKPSDDLCLTFYIIAGAVFLLAVTLIVVSIWSFVRKLPYYVLLEVKIDLPYFLFPAGVLSVPCCWIIYLMQKNAMYRYRFIHLLIVMQIIAVGLLITGTCIGMLYASKLKTAESNLTTSLDTAALNASLQLALLEYEANVSVMSAWDKTQNQLECCGIINYQDWTKLEKTIPLSCCIDMNCTAEHFYTRGCLEALSVDLVWQNNFSSSHCFIGSVIHVCAAIIVTTVYLCYKCAVK